MKRQISHRAGFTLTEILIVVGIISLLAPIAIPGFVRSRAASQRTTCINNMRQVDSAKQQWATETSQPVNTTPTATDIAPYVNRAGSLASVYCPTDPAKSFATSYALNDIGTATTCIIQPANHALP
jgi:prepilin-type N-terminal cleavage/methylation domain-containing protein